MRSHISFVHLHLSGKIITDAPYSVIHRHDYHAILLDEAKRLGATLVVGQHVTEVDVAGDRVVTKDGTEWVGDVIVGADGKFSSE